ncbi:MATE family efflux transporter [Metamycoplasma buccale]|uniref:MATE family efflux transporter n=1 Tax=Metamycoplasma buccale TaxID=55602 RepID=UPI00398EA2C8
MNNWKCKLKNKLQVFEFKYIFKLFMPLFIQTFTLALVLFIGSLATTFYKRVYHVDGSYNGYYFYAISKILTVYKITTFVPIIYQLGVIVIASNLYGQEKHQEINKLIHSSIYISLLLNLFIYLIMAVLAPTILEAAGSKNNAIYSWISKDGYETFQNNLKIAKFNSIDTKENINTIVNGGVINGTHFSSTYPLVLEKNELLFTVNFLRLTMLDLFAFSIGQILIAALQAIKKNKYSMIAVIASILSRIIWTYSILFIPKSTNLMLLVSLETLIGGLIQTIVAYIFVYKYLFNKFKIHFKNSWNSKYIKEIFKIGLPIAIESGIWYVSQYMIARAIPFSGLNDHFIGIYRSINNLYDIFASFALALSYITSAIVAQEIGKHDYERAYKMGNATKKLAIYGQLIMSLISIILTYPLLKIFAIDSKLINKIGYILMFLMMIKSLADIGNLTTLRALWGVNNVLTPIWISLLSMIALQLSSTYLISIFLYKNNQRLTAESFFILLYASTILDQLVRSTLYGLRWKSKTWIKYAKAL